MTVPDEAVQAMLEVIGDPSLTADDVLPELEAAAPVIRAQVEAELAQEFSTVEAAIRQRDRAERLRDAARLLATLDAYTADAVLGEDHEYDDLFERGLLRTVRQFGDEHVAQITDEGRAFITAALSEPQQPGRGRNDG